MYKDTGEEIVTLDCNEICGIEHKTRPTPISGQKTPLVTACFDHNDNLFVQLFSRFEQKQFNFLYSYKTNEVISEVKVLDII